MRTRRPHKNKEVIYYVTPELTSDMISSVIRWLNETATTIVHVHDYATPDKDVWKLFDRGYKLIRNGKAAPEVYQELKNLIGINDPDRISEEFFQALEDIGLVEKNILDEDEDL